VERKAAKGAKPAASVREEADRCELVFACLPSPEISRQVALGPDGVAGGKALKVYSEISTIGGDGIVEIAEGLAARGIDVLDSPVIGSTVAVESRTAGALVSGPEAAFERARRWYETYAGRVFYLGPKAGAAQAAKVMNNAIAYAAVLATCEAVALGMKSGIDMQTALAIINQGSGANFLSERVFPAFYLQGRFDGMGAMKTGVKDMRCFLAEAERLGMETPMAQAVTALSNRVWASGEPGRDMLQTLHFFTDLAGLPRAG
jgi:3-hydroxyisobutyrate dehydrogenase-like beta-hydroxyacid dehydrogenase